MFYVGIDPGLSGGITMITDNGVVYELESMPVIKINRKNRINEDALDSILNSMISNADRVAFEGISGIPPKWGASSSCYYGVSWGIAWGMTFSYCKFFGVPSEVVPPKTWKKEILGGVTGQSKGASIQAACRLFPSSTIANRIGKKDGLAEALLLAEYARRLG